tara:strand:+ start:1062 stop:2180 length:1119 start_codon:yes stop_codon:yes gene_type:complete
MKDKVDSYIEALKSNLNDKEIFNILEKELSIKTQIERQVLEILIEDNLSKHIKNEEIYQVRRNKLSNLKKLKLPNQRSPEWYELRRSILTASSLGSAIDKCYFQSRDELLLSKIEETPFEPNPITEWGVKYEDVAIMFYEELYNVKVLDFGLIPHPTFNIFGASPDGICDDTGNKEYIARMVEIKCPPKRKFTKTVPHHYWLQVQGQLEVCDLDECDFFQVKIEEYDTFDDYCKDQFIIDDSIIDGRTELNFPKGVVITYKNDDNLSYIYSKLNESNETLLHWIDQQPKEKLHEIKWWKIERYETTLVLRDKNWWIETIDKILCFYKDLQYYKEQGNLEILQKKIIEAKKRKKKIEALPLNDFQLISDEEDN